MRAFLVSLVEKETNARLYIGEIHGSVLGKFSVDGAALYYDGSPIAVVDTVEISHNPLSLIDKTIRVSQIRLVNPRFYLTRLSDGSYNVDHISKSHVTTGGKFSWTILLKNLILENGEFHIQDSTKAPTHSQHVMGDSVFNSRSFSLEKIEAQISGRFTGEEISAAIKNISFNLPEPHFMVDSLRFDFFTSKMASEIGGFYLKTGSSHLSGDFTLFDQSLLDSLSLDNIRTKQLSVNLVGKGIEFKLLNAFVPLPVDAIGKFSFATAISGTFDSLNVKRAVLITDSSTIPVEGFLFNIGKSSFHANLNIEDAAVNLSELSAFLKPQGLPDLSSLLAVRVSVNVSGSPDNLALKYSIKNEKVFVGGVGTIADNMYSGKTVFSSVNPADFLHDRSFAGALNGSVDFQLRAIKDKLPAGYLQLQVDSSLYDGVSVHNVALSAVSSGDSLKLNITGKTSAGNLNGHAYVSVKEKKYSAAIAFDEFNISPFIHFQASQTDLSGFLRLQGNGFNMDSAQSSLTAQIDRGKVGDYILDNKSIILNYEASGGNKSIYVSSPFVTASLKGFLGTEDAIHNAPNTLKFILRSFISKFTDAPDTTNLALTPGNNYDAELNVNVRDASFFSRLVQGEKFGGSIQINFRLSADSKNLRATLSAAADSIFLKRDSLSIEGRGVRTQAAVVAETNGNIWKRGEWSLDASVENAIVNETHLQSKIFRMNYKAGDSTAGEGLINFTMLGSIDTTIEFYIDGKANATTDSMSISIATLIGKVLGARISNVSQINAGYCHENFYFNAAPLSLMLDPLNGLSATAVLDGKYSLKDSSNLKLKFENLPLNGLERLAHLDTTSLKLDGLISGTAEISDHGGERTVGINFSGSRIFYNGAFSQHINGSLDLEKTDIKIQVRLSKTEDSTQNMLSVNGNIPLSEGSSKQLNISLITDSLDISFLTPFVSAFDDFGGLISGSMIITGTYSHPVFDGIMNVEDGKVRLAINKINYLYNAKIIGSGDKLVLSPLVVRNVPGETGGTLTVDGYVQLSENTIRQFNLSLDGSLLLIRSTPSAGINGIYGNAIVGSGSGGLKFEGNLRKPFFKGSIRIQSADLTLLPIEKQNSGQNAQEIVYHFVGISTNGMGQTEAVSEHTAHSMPSSSGSFIDSLRYDLDVETKDNFNLRMIFNPATNEELVSILGGRLHLSNLSGGMELTGDVNVMPNSYYNFYRQFSATGKLKFTGEPLNPELDITAQYRETHYADTSATTPENVVVQLHIGGTFRIPEVNISMTVDNRPFTGDPQTNAISFILTNQFENELTNTQKRSVAENLWTQAGAGLFAGYGSSILSGVLTQLFSREFNFIKSAELRYTSLSNLTNPDVAITTQFGNATIRVGGQVFSDINNTDVSVDYPVASLLGNKIYLQLSRKVAVSNRSYYQRETINTLRIFYQVNF
ncbi:MAG: translocation/assembly module TamB domain-containing protein [Candidatus Kryptoniota bacterium]